MKQGSSSNSALRLLRTWLVAACLILGAHAQTQAQNTPPTITSLDDVVVAPGTSPVGPFSFTISDAQTAPESLSVSTSSSNTLLVPQLNVLLNGSGNQRSLIIFPANGQTGTTTITVTVGDGSSTAVETFTLTVGTANSAPTISNIPDQTVLTGSLVGPLAFTVSDTQTAADSLILTPSSSNTTLVPNTSIFLTGSGANRSVLISPAAGQTGTTTISIAVSDGSLTGTETFVLTVNSPAPANTAPTISAIADQTVSAGAAVGPLLFTIGDAQTAAASLTLSASSTNTTLLPLSNILFGGAGDQRSVVLVPASGQQGQSLITITVSDGTLSTNETFLVTVGQVIPPNTAPTIANIADQTVATGVVVGPISFVIGDAQTDPANLTLAATSSNTTLIPQANVLFSGAGANRSIIIAPASGQTGTSTITVTVSDGTLTASDSFVVTVGQSNPPNTAPTISDIPNQNVVAGQVLGPVSFTVNDQQTAAANLVVTATSSNTGIIPNNSILFSGNGNSRSLVITTLSGQTGASTITVSVSDGALSASDTFLVSVNPTGGNTPPTISDVEDQYVPTGTTGGPFSFRVTDAQTPAADLTVTATSTNPFLIPNANILFSGTGSDRSFVLAPLTGASGTTLITLTVSDGTLTATDTFTVNVSQNTAPTISPVSNQTVGTGSVVGPLAFTIADGQTPVSKLVLTAISTNPSLIPPSSIVFGGSGGSRTVTLTPTPALTGESTITLTVDDGVFRTRVSFVVTVTFGGPNTPPSISAIADQNAFSGSSVGPVNFSISDAQTPAANLQVTASSSNGILIPSASIQISGTSTERALTMVPTPNQTGSTVITVNVSDGSLSTNRTFLVTIRQVSVNTAPRISDIANQTTSMGIATGQIPFTVVDSESPAADLVVRASSSNTNLVSNGNIVLGGSGGSRHITLTPTEGRTGSASIVVTVSDGTFIGIDTFTLTVSGVANTAPLISNIADQTTTAGVPTPSIAFTVSDAETAATALVVTASSSNTNVLPNAAIQLGGSGTNRTLVLTPPGTASGSATVTVTVSDGSLTASDTFQLAVSPVQTNTAPVISNIADVTTSVGVSVGPIPFTVSDAETPAAALQVSVTSSNTVLVPSPNILLGGAGTNRAIILTPVDNLSGTSLITVTVSDGSRTASDTFILTVGSVTPNDPPTITPIANITLATGVASSPIAITIGDTETAAAALGLSAVSSNPTLVPTAGLQLGGAGANRTLVVTPAAGQVGTATVTVTVSDGDKSATSAFTVTVSNIQVGPTITQHPQPQSTRIGGSATFSVTATGTAPLGYQWLLNGASILGATNSTYTINDVQQAQLGNYSVIVSNPLGFIISQVATLQVASGPRFSAIRQLTGGLIQITITGKPGETYDLLSASNLGEPQVTIATLLNTSGTVTFIDPDSVTLRRRFYNIRVRE